MPDRRQRQRKKPGKKKGPMAPEGNAPGEIRTPDPLIRSQML
jgi:hypothetical protein